MKVEKNKIFTLVIFCGLFLFSQVTNLSAKENTSFWEENSKAFADDLLADGFLDEAESEYKRFLFMYPDSLQKNQALSSLAGLYNFNNDLNGAKWLFNNFFDSQALELKEDFTLLYARLSFLERSQEDFLQLYNKTSPLLNELKPELQFLLPFSNELLQNNVNQALELGKNLPESILMEDFKKLSSMCGSYKRKSPGLALFLSTIFPGSGKWYADSFAAGLSSFIYVGSFTAGSVYSVYKFGWQDWRPYTFGLAALCFYAADLYGAYKSAQRYNQALYRHLLEQTDKVYEAIY